MFKLLLLFASSLYLYGLTVTIDTGKEDAAKYSILRLKDDTPFLCVEKSQEGDKRLICAFTKKPATPFMPLKNEYFEITAHVQESVFFLIIKPLKKLFFMPVPFNLIHDDTVFRSNISRAKSWLIVGYSGSLPLIKGVHQEYKKGLNLPITFTKQTLPYIGGLDLRGNPIHVEQLKDISLYVKIKEAYKNKDYHTALNLIGRSLKEYPNSVFNSEYMYYKINIDAKLQSYQELVKTSKLFLRRYSGDEHVAEILLRTARAYSKLGRTADADYFFDRLLSEHGDTKFAKLGMIDLADSFMRRGKGKMALSYYMQALDETNSLDVAALAAYKIALYDLSNNMIDSAVSYTQKIIDAKKQFFQMNPQKTLRLATQLAEKKKYPLAARMAKIALENISQEDDTYEKLLKSYGIWAAKAKEKKAAVKALSEYIIKFPQGEYIDLVTKTKDALFFDDKDKNTTQRLHNYNALIQKYGGQEIAKKALHRKVELLFSLKRYGEILQLHPTEMPQMITKSARALLEKELEQKECYKAMELYGKYKGINKSGHFDEKLYHCAMKTLDYKSAKAIAKKYVSSTILTERERWMYRYALSDYKLENYKEAITVGEDLATIIGDKQSKYNDIYRVLFDAYTKEKKSEKMLWAIKKIVTDFGVSFKDISRYMRIVDLGGRLKDNNMIITYGRYVYNLQQKAQTFPETPSVEFALYQAYIDENRLGQAAEVIHSLDAQDLTPSQRAQQKYFLGSVLQKEWKNGEAKKAFEAAIKADKNSPWASLAQDAMKLL
jgi:TolA-binding protein